MREYAKNVNEMITKLLWSMQIIHESNTTQPQYFSLWGNGMKLFVCQRFVPDFSISKNAQESNTIFFLYLSIAWNWVIVVIQTSCLMLQSVNVGLLHEAQQSPVHDDTSECAQSEVNKAMNYLSIIVPSHVDAFHLHGINMQ